MTKITVKQVEGGYSIETFSDRYSTETFSDSCGQESIHPTLGDVFAKQLELFEGRTEKGEGEKYGRVVVKRIKDIPKDVIDKQKATVESVTGPPNVEEKVKHEDVIQFGSEKGAVEKIKEAEKNEK